MVKRTLLLSILPYSAQSLLSVQFLDHRIGRSLPFSQSNIAYRSSSCLTASKAEEPTLVDGDDADAAATSSAASLQLPENGSHDELMYTLGVNLARQLGDVRPLVETPQEMSLVAKGLLDTVIGRLNENEQRTLLSRRGGELNELIVERANAIKEQLAVAGREMLQSMAETEGAVTLPSGVVVHVLEYGPDGKDRGVRPTKASTVKIQYHGTLADGTVFDSTLGGEPVAFPLASVISGWCEGVQKLHEGETAMLGIPPSQGYGAKGTPDGRIPGDSTLFFKIQLLEVMSAGIGGGPSLLGVDGKKLQSKSTSSGGGGGGLLGADGKPI